MASNKGYWSASGMTKKQYDDSRMEKAMKTFSERYPGHEELFNNRKNWKAIAEFMGFVSKKFDKEYYDTDSALEIFAKTRYKIGNEFVRDNYDYFLDPENVLYENIKEARDRIKEIKEVREKMLQKNQQEDAEKKYYYAPEMRDKKGRFVKGWSKKRGVWRDEKGRFTSPPKPRLVGKYWRDAFGRFVKAPGT